jgi:hypothetical protein
VTDIGDFAFADNVLTSLTFPDSITRIGYSAFLNNQLTNVAIPFNVISIGDSAFKLNKLTNVIFLGNYPPATTSSNVFHELAFDDNPTLQTIDACDYGNGWNGISFNNGDTDILVINTIGCYIPFDGLNYFRITNILFYVKNVASIIQQGCLECHDSSQGINANLENYDELSSYIASGLGERLLSKPTSDGHGGNAKMFDTDSDEFKALSEFLELELESNNKPSVEVFGRLRSSNDTVIDIPDSIEWNGVVYLVKSVAVDAFTNFLGDPITSVSFGSNVTSIGDGAFRNNQLTSVTFLGDYNSAFFENAFLGNTSLDTITACAGSQGWDDISFSNGTSAIKVTIIKCEISIDGFTYTFEFVEANELEYYEDNVSSIIQSCVGCHGVVRGNLKPFTSNATSGFAESNYNVLADYIAEGFKDTLLEKVIDTSHGGGQKIIPDSEEYQALVEFIGLETSNSGGGTATVTGLVSPNVPQQIVIPDDVEWNGVTYPVTQIGDRAFVNNPIITVTMGDKVQSIGNEAFSNTLLMAVKFGSGLISIGNLAFFQFQDLSGSDIPAWLIPGLTSVTIPDSVTSIGTSAFCRQKLTEVSIPDGVTSIADSAFCDINSVTFLGEYSQDFNDRAFYGKADLTVEACGESASWDGVAFKTEGNTVQVEVVFCSSTGDSGIPLWLLKAAIDAQAAKANL